MAQDQTPIPSQFQQSEDGATSKKTEATEVAKTKTDQGLGTLADPIVVLDTPLHVDIQLDTDSKRFLMKRCSHFIAIWGLREYRSMCNMMVMEDWMKALELWVALCGLDILHKNERFRFFREQMRTVCIENQEDGWYFTRGRDLFWRWKELKGELLHELQAESDKDIVHKFGGLLLRFHRSEIDRRILREYEKQDEGCTSVS